MTTCPDPHKVRYRTKGQAKDAAKRSGAVFGHDATMRAYECAGCKGWHLTSMPQEQFRSMKRHLRRTGRGE